jgi:YidC/Oxa1 family membrane protein insertase
MIWDIFSATVYAPLYNGLVFLISIVPGGSVGVAVITLTILIKVILFPLARQATRTQFILKKIAPLLEEIKNKYKDNQQEQVKNMLAIYKANNVHPLSGILVVIIQLPVIFGLYWVFYKGGLPAINEQLLYSSSYIPQMVQMDFLGIHLSEKSILLAALVGISQYVIGRVTFDAPAPNTKPGESLKDDIMRSLHLQMKYILPVLLAVFAYILSAVVALYWVTGNIFNIVQDILIKRRLRAIEMDKQQHGTENNNNS